MKSSQRVTESIEIWFNGEPRKVVAGTTIALLLESLAINATRSAVELNLQLVPRAAHGARTLESGDRLEVVTLAGGG